MKQPNAGRKRNLNHTNHKKPEQDQNKEALIEQNNKQEPLPKEPPAYLSKYAKNLWKILVPELLKQGLITKSDQTNLEMFCSQYHEYREAYAAIKKYGTIYEDDNNIIRKNPAVNVVDTCAKNIRSLGMTLGVDFNSRSQFLDMKKDDGKDEVDIQKALREFGGK